MINYATMTHGKFHSQNISHFTRECNGLKIKFLCSYKHTIRVFDPIRIMCQKVQNLRESERDLLLGMFAHTRNLLFPCLLSFQYICFTFSLYFLLSF